MAARRLRLHPEAGLDLLEGLGFYLARSEVAAERSYRVTDTEIQVFAVAHAKRRPFYWSRRRF